MYWGGGMGLASHVELNGEGQQGKQVITGWAPVVRGGRDWQ